MMFWTEATIEASAIRMKILQRIVNETAVSINYSQFGFAPRRGTTDAIFVLPQLHEKYQAMNKELNVAFVAYFKNSEG